MMDDAYRLRPFDRFGGFSLWDRAERLIPLLLDRCIPDQRGAVIKSMFGECAAIGWLTSLFRRETFAHERFGERPQAQSEWLVTDPELDDITAIMLNRYRAMTLDDFLNVPETVSALFAWKQGGDEEGPRSLIQQTIQTDEGLIDLLRRMASPVMSSSRGTYEVLKRRHLEDFMDFDAVSARVNLIAGNAADAELQAEAVRIARAFQNGERF